MDEINNIDNKKQLVGEVVESPMAKTTIVKVERRFPHPVYDKYIVRNKKYYAHDESNSCNKGDVVRIEEYKPTSKLKRWIVLNIEKKAE